MKKFEAITLNGVKIVPILEQSLFYLLNFTNLDSKVHGANMGPTWVLSAPGGSHVGPINLAMGISIEVCVQSLNPMQHILQSNNASHKCHVQYV